MCKYYKEYASQSGLLFVLNSLFGEFGERDNAIKQPKFSVWRFSQDTGIYQVVNALLTAYFIENLSFFLVSPMSAKENFVLQTAVLWTFTFTIKELQENQRFLFSSQMHTKV